MQLHLYYGRPANDGAEYEDHPLHPDVALECTDVIWTFGTIEVLFRPDRVYVNRVWTGWEPGVREHSLRMRTEGDMIVIHHPCSDGTTRTTYFSDFRISED